jgi:hypothetical protein
MVPVALVTGVGAVAEPVPPVEAVYHNKLVPLAVKAVAVAFCQYDAVAVTVGVTGAAFVVTAI